MSAIELGFVLLSFLAIGFDNVCAHHHDQWNPADKTIYKFSCQHSVYLLEQTEFLMNLLNELVSANEERPVDYSNNGCITSEIFRGKVFDNMKDSSTFSHDFDLFIAKELQNSGTSIYLYMFSINPFTIYRLEAEPNVRMLVEGCIVNRQNKISKQRILAYNAIKSIESICVKKAGSEDCMDSNSEMFCPAYNELLIPKANEYSRRPVLLYPGSTPDFRSIIENMSKEKQSKEDASESETTGSGLERFSRISHGMVKWWNKNSDGIQFPPIHSLEIQLYRINIPLYSENMTNQTYDGANDVPMTYNTSRFEALASQLVMCGYELGRNIHICNGTKCRLEAEAQNLYFSNHKKKIVLIIDSYWNYFAFLLFDENWLNKYVHSIVVISMPLDKSARCLEQHHESSSDMSAEDDSTPFETITSIFDMGHLFSDPFMYLSMLFAKKEASAGGMLIDNSEEQYLDSFQTLSLDTFSRMELLNVDIHCIYASDATQIKESQIDNSTIHASEGRDDVFMSNDSNPCAMWKKQRLDGTYEKVIDAHNILKSDDFFSYIKSDVLGLK